MKKLLLIVSAIAICVLTVFGVKSVFATSQPSNQLFDVVTVDEPNGPLGRINNCIVKHEIEGYQVVTMTNYLYNGKLTVLITFAKK
ncbi:hypothetical protein [Mucilaginibacter sp. OK283]|uniref:hypothetical protein n=1 Tax=Mucilaginibacter sp. OK283 TaxID=1881049 RepID=UPI0008C49BFE|nr:hypothetical protein [Mucilaginibacter sp. OK283]SEP03620.1 hypothetical protein SAMN05428947_10665 [Mucilaginibacter sp. OK283]